MAIAIDANSSSHQADVTTPTLAHTCTGSNRGLYVLAALRDPGSGFSITGVTYNSVAMTQENFIDQTAGPGDQFYCSFWSLENPASGTNNIQVTYSAEVDDALFGGISLTGVDQTDSTEASVEASGNDATPTINVTTVSANAMVVDGMADFGDATTITEGAGQTLGWEISVGAQFPSGAQSTEPKVTPGSVTMSWTLNEGNVWNIFAVSVKPAAGISIPVVYHHRQRNF
ncbi:hypothetical protein LCGC14_2183160 [marine sediment metagenome]|uniref:Uncharacterized protein n=1 Tax=marine sediment metagenome TaxID=412755 RepID=A0A0F9GHG4_9ZZZZ